jgi:2-polyprenyl-6-methoxyphenol hydroxylase-like FAD-dependent oxidoreductase
MRPIVIVGASVAGASCALRLARVGVSSVVLDQRVGVADKVCGEGLLPAGRELLSAVLPGVDALGAPYAGFEFQLPGRPPLGWRFPEGASGLGIERQLLDGALREALAAEPRVDFRPGTTVRGLERTQNGWQVRLANGALHARCVVGADGARSRVRAAA